MPVIAASHVTVSPAPSNSQAIRASEMARDDDIVDGVELTVWARGSGLEALSSADSGAGLTPSAVSDAEYDRKRAVTQHSGGGNEYDPPRRRTRGGAAG